MRHLLANLLLLLELHPLIVDAQGLRQQLVEQGNLEFTGNSVELLPTAPEKYASMFGCISRAERFVHLEYFSITHDSVGTYLMHLLEQKAREGVEVRLMVDAYGNGKSRFPISDERLDSLSAAGVQFTLYDPFRFPWINHAYHRDHRKIVVVDGLVAYTGGMNVAEYYIKGTQRSGHWRDMHMALRGPVVNEYERIFEKIWEKETKEKLDTLRYRYPYPSTAQDSCPIVVVNREPGRMSKVMRKAYVAALDDAKESVRIVNPYPTSVRSVSRAIKRALKRGVVVEIMASGSSDVTITPDVVGIRMKKLMKRGCRIYYYDGGFHHTKVMTIDGTHCTVGTANIDGRSMLFDYEVNAFIFSPHVTAQLDSIFNDDLIESKLLTPEGFKERFNLKHRIIGRAFSPFKSVL